MSSTSNLLTPVFRVHTSANETRSKAEGRPIFEDLEVVEIRFAGDRQKVAVFPAHDAEPNATRIAIASGEISSSEVITYAQVYAPQYQQFKSSTTQSVSGTPVEELPFVTAAKRSELKALNIHTAEALAALDGTPLKQLGIGGRELKNQAAAYLENAAGSADVTALAAENVALRQEMDEMRAMMRAFQPAAPAPIPEEDPEPDYQGKSLDDCTDAELKAYIKAETGEPVRGNPGREKLVARAMEIATAPDSDKAH
jgi:hypothetical protein